MPDTTFTLTVVTDNAAFDDSPTGELARLLRLTAGRVEDGELHGNLLDISGNRVGEFVWRLQ